MTDTTNPIVTLATAIAETGSRLQDAIQARRGAETVYDAKVAAADAAYMEALASADAELKTFTDEELRARNTFQAQNAAWVALVSDLDDDNGLQLIVVEAEDPAEIPVPGVIYEDVTEQPAPMTEEPLPAPPAEDTTSAAVEEPAAEVPTQPATDETATTEAPAPASV